MPNDECRLFLEELEDIERLTINATFEDMPRILQRWFYTLDRSPDLISSIIDDLEGESNFEKVNDENIVIQNGMGNNKFNWPLGKEERLGAQLIFLRAASQPTYDFFGFLTSFYYESHGNLNDANYNFTNRLFEPHVREFIRYVEMRLDDQSIPASDRIVTIDHNSKDFITIRKDFDAVETAVAQSNSLENREMIQAELAAGKAVIEAPKARRSIVKSVVIAPLKYLSKAVADNALSISITALLTAIAAYFGIAL